ncbi:conjugative transfer relaxase/helicase TraI [Arsenophonus sp. ENCA]|uniref:conjugative transfer relaxase/helicase TraI n=1 Tax=Arsenophonus sp. ENCA TaxID=1987579 RepID=UPI000BC45EDA|nr:conjugative transfer relaxase/helicase TraI [Arsenophonus sp. ENCA]PAU99449.1 conjugative transfer relaxase/helicase TraI [Arsenophonus sp. ENCA]
MISFNRIKSAQSAGDYYTQKDNYYVLESMEERYFGKGAEILGLTGEFDKNTFRELLEGKLPDGTELTFHKDGKNQHRPGYDLTFSAPKSISIMALVADDKRLLEAHNKAVEVALSQAEKFTSVRTMSEGQKQTVLTDNLIAVLFNHDTSRDVDPQLHTHSVVINATQHNEKWQALASDTVGKTGFSEMVLANKIALGQIYRHALREQTEGLGYETEIVGKHGLWELKNVPTEVFSKRTQAIDNAVGKDASPKARDIATLDTRQKKTQHDPQQLRQQWQAELSATGFDAEKYQAQAEINRLQSQNPTTSPTIEPEQIETAISQAISQLSDRQTEFTYSQLLAKAINQLPAQPGVIEQARAGIDQAIEKERLIPLDKEKGLFTSDIQLLDELSLKQLIKQHQKISHGVIPHATPINPNISPAARQWLCANPTIAVMSGIGGASVRRDRVAELVTLTKQTGREGVVLAPDLKSRQYLTETLPESQILNRQAINQETVFSPNSTLIVQDAEKLTLKEMVNLTDKAIRENLQLVLMDNQQRKGTGYALSILRQETAVFRYSGIKPVQTAIVSEPDKTARLKKLAKDYTRTLAQGIDSVAQITGNREQKHLTGYIREALKTQELLGKNEVTITTLKPQWLTAKSRTSRDSYREGWVMECWDSEKKSKERFIIDRVTAVSNTLTLINQHGEQRLEKISQLNSNWSLYQPVKIAISEGERLRLLAREGKGKLKTGDRLHATQLKNGEITLTHDNTKKALTIKANHDVFSALKIEQDYVQPLGGSISDKSRVFAAVTQRDLNQDTLNQLARSGEKLVLYSALDAQKTAQKLAKNPHYQTTIEQVNALSGEQNLDKAIAKQKNQLFTPTQQAISLAIPQLEQKNITFTQAQLLATALNAGDKTLSQQAIEQEIDAQIKNQHLMKLPIVEGFGTNLLINKASFETEKQIIQHIAEGKSALSPLMSTVPDSALNGLTPGQKEATKLILETPDRFIAIQGYAGVGKTTQFKAVLSAISTLPKDKQPQIIGLAPTHRAISEMQTAGVDAKTLAAFLYEESQKIAQGEQPNHPNTLFVIDEAAMIGNTDMAKAYHFIAAGNGRAVMSGDSAQLQPISPGQPFRLQQQRSAIDNVVMKEIVRQTPQLKPAIVQMIAGNIKEAIHTVNQLSPDIVPRKENAWIPDNSIVEMKENKEASMMKDNTDNLHQAIGADFLGRTKEAQEKTLIITPLNADRHAINALIHEEKQKNGELQGNEVTLPILVNTNVPDGQLRNINTWATHQKALALKNNQYWQITAIDAKNDTVTLRNEQGQETLLSPRQAVKEGITLYQPETLTVSQGDKIRFTKSDNEQGFLANSVWQIQAVDEKIITLTNGKQTRTLTPTTDKQHAHIDLAYAITTHASQGASEQFAITLAKTQGKNKAANNTATAYVALSRAKAHVQVYTDNIDDWTALLEKPSQKATAHDIVEQKDINARDNAKALFKQGQPLETTAQGRAVLRASNLSGESMGKWLRIGKKYPQNYLGFPVFDQNGKKAGVWMTRLNNSNTQKPIGNHTTEKRIGSQEARFLAFQRSQNGKTALVNTLTEAVEIAANHPQHGIIVRLEGNDMPHNPKAITGGQQWVNQPKDEFTQTKHELEENAIKIAKSFGKENDKFNPLSSVKAKEYIDSLKETQTATLTPEQRKALEDYQQKQNIDEIVKKVVNENRLTKQLQQIEREMVRNLAKEKTIGD